MTRKKVGLTLGKFAPFHKGHQLLIETALSEVDALSVIVYDCPETTLVPLNVRSEWIRSLYPTVRVIEAWDGPAEMGETSEIKKKHEDYVLNVLKMRGITHFYSSEFYGEHMSRALGAVNRIVDKERVAIPVSGTAIRQDPFAFRNYLHPRVYRDLVTNIVFLGAPSTGKTTLASRIAQEYGTAWMPEYGREYWETHQMERRLSRRQLLEVAEGHLLYQANRYLFTDTNALTTYLFSLHYHGAPAKRLAELADRAAARYDLVFVCDTDIPYEDTWDRSGDANRDLFQKRLLGELAIRRIPYFVVQGNLDTRVRYVRTILNRHSKYQNLLAIFTGAGQE